MSDINQRIQEKVEAFVEDLSALVRRAAVQAVEASLGVVAEKVAAPSPRSRKASAAKPQRKKAAAVVGQKRPPEEIAQTLDNVLAYVTENPGVGVEQIAAALGTKTRLLTLPIRKLLESGALTRDGEKRATKYSPAAVESSGRSSRSSRKSRRRR
ncbi:MAG: DNA-binding protein [Polyangiaceae bacterium]|nr:DNA-binding protein [Polyangiaceae bacterium]